MGECLKTDLRPPLGLTSPPLAETAVPSAYEHSDAFCSDFGDIGLTACHALI
jgi:hypothetical protein